MHRLASGPSVTTRRRRLLKGSALTNPFKYPNCLLCKGGFYREAELRAHYKRRHSLDFGDAPLPTSDIQIVCLEKDRQTSNRCSICKAQFKTLGEVGARGTGCAHCTLQNFGTFSTRPCTQGYVLSEQIPHSRRFQKLECSGLLMNLRLKHLHKYFKVVHNL